MGTLTVESNALLGVTFDLSNGIQVDPTRFEFVNGNTAAPGNVEVNIAGETAGTAADVVTIASNTAIAINEAGLNITATASGNRVNLVNEEDGVFGNTPVTKSTTDALTVTDMVSGVGCPVEQACARNRDCVSGDCQYGRCQ
jgi:hypothetical protein